jgi:translation initiation factor IF-2
MDQTVEAINHSKAAGVPIIVAVNKIDKDGSNPDNIKQQLSEYGLVPEAWGGDVIFSEVSAKKKIGIEELLELIILQADIMELKADPDKPAHGVVIESKLDKGRGPVGTVLIQEGTLREGDAFVSKTEYGRVRAMIDDKGNRVKEAGPSTPVEVIGFSEVPQVGVDFVGVEDEKTARTIGEYWRDKKREKGLSGSPKVTLEQLYEKIKEGTKEFNVVIKGDVQGSIGALSDALLKLSTNDVKLNVIHGSTGTITETDIMLASASDAIIIGFKVRPDARTMDIAEREGVDIKLYDVIYDVISDTRAAMEGLLEPIYEEVVEGRAEVRELFKVPRVGVVAGSYVTDGKITRNSNLRLVRDGIVIYDGKLLSLKRFKDDAKEVSSGFECGIGIEGFNDIRVNDIIEAYTKNKIERKL